MASVREIHNKKGISYKIEVSNGYDASGKKIRETTTFVPDPSLTKKQQEKALQKFVMEFEDKVNNGNRISGDKTTLAEFTEEWLKTYAENQLEKTTLHRYRYVLDTNILPALGHMKIGKIRPYDIERFFGHSQKTVQGMTEKRGAIPMKVSGKQRLSYLLSSPPLKSGKS